MVLWKNYGNMEKKNYGNMKKLWFYGKTMVI